MRKVILLFAALILSSVVRSQTMTINFNNGTNAKYKMSDIKSIEFDEEENNYDNSLSIHLDKAGTLSSKISISQASNLLQLKLSGHMDARDFDFIKWKCMKIEVVDLADIVIDKYVGADGTNEGYDATYEANEIPLGAFFYWNTSKKYNYEGMPKDEGMASLKKIVLPQGIKAIRRNAFARAYNLTEINIPEGVETIDYVAFAICTSLEELRLPSTLKTVGKLAFADMNKMKRFYVSATTPPTASSNSFQGITDATLYVPSGTESLYRNATGWKNFSKIESINDDNNSGNNAVIEEIAYDDTEYFEITINGEKINVERWSGSWFATYEKIKKDGMDVYPYGGMTESIKISYQDAMQCGVFAGYTTKDLSTVLPKSVGTYEVIIKPKNVTDFGDNVGLIIFGGNMSYRTVTSGSLTITKVSKYKDQGVKIMYGRDYSYATEGTFEYVLKDNWDGNENKISGKFRLVF